MLPSDDDWRTQAMESLLGAMVSLRSTDEAAIFLRDLCTVGELQAMAQRWSVARMLDDGLHYAEISRLTGASTATITRIAAWLRHGEGGYRLVLDRNASPASAGEDG